MSVAVLGTAHLFGATTPDRSRELLDAAWSTGFRAFDTAPLYGHGHAEDELGQRVGAWPERPQLTSKVGLEPVPPSSPGVRIAKAAARRLPGRVRNRLRAGDGDGPRGDFDPDVVRRSVERTLRRVGRVDRLMLHEVRAEDITDDLLAMLSAFRDAGDVGQLGVATLNVHAGPAVRRAPDLLTAAHVEVGPFAAVADLPTSVGTVVGHGALGPGGDALRRMSPLLGSGAGSTWRAVTDGTRWAGSAGLAGALVARAAALPLTDVIVATSRPDRLAELRELAGGTVRMPSDVQDALAGLVRAASAASG